MSVGAQLTDQGWRKTIAVGAKACRKTFLAPAQLRWSEGMLDDVMAMTTMRIVAGDSDAVSGAEIVSSDWSPDQRKAETPKPPDPRLGDAGFTRVARRRHLL